MEGSYRCVRRADASGAEAISAGGPVTLSGTTSGCLPHGPPAAQTPNHYPPPAGSDGHSGPAGGGPSICSCVHVPRYPHPHLCARPWHSEGMVATVTDIMTAGMVAGPSMLPTRPGGDRPRCPAASGGPSELVRQATYIDERRAVFPERISWPTYWAAPRDG